MPDHAHTALEYPVVVATVAGHAHSPYGRELLLTLAPHTRIEDARADQGLHRDLLLLAGTGKEPPPAAPPDVRPLLERLSTAGASFRGEELWQLRVLLDQAAFAGGWNRGRREETPWLSKLLDELDPLPALHRELGRILEPSGEVRDQASPDLAKIRRAMRGLRDRLSKRLEAAARALGVNESFVTIREGRYVIAVPASQRRLVPGTPLGHSGSGVTVFVEPREAAEENSQLAELALDELREVDRILRALTEDARRELGALRRDLGCLARLDAGQAVASWARAVRGVLPELTEERRLNLVMARHPLLVDRHARGELREPPVPLNLELDEIRPMLLVTGPNMGGKTVAVKTVGLLALLAMAGLPVPAEEGTRIPWFDRIVCDIGDEQSLLADVSTFLSHLRRVVEALSRATPSSLVLLDELGSGTDPTEGAALGQAVLERLLARRTLCIATTHHGALKSFAHGTDGVQNASMAFDEESLKPRFTLVVGVPGLSRAIQVAERFGMEPAVLDRARELLPAGERDLGALIEELSELRSQAAREGEELARTRERLAEREAALKDALSRLDAERRERKQAELHARRELLRKLESQIDEYRKKLRLDRRASAETLEEARGLARRVSEEIDAEAGAERVPERGQPVERIRIGERVYVPALQAEGMAEAEPDGDGRVRVRIGSATALLPLAQLRSAPPAADSTGRGLAAPRRPHAALEPLEAPREIDVRGYEPDEAIRAVERFLEDAAVGGVGQARIIHGKGKGVLREHMRRWLKDQPLVKEFRLGELREGGVGVTIVTLE